MPAGGRAEAAVKAWVGGKPVVPDPGAFPLGPGKNGFDVKLPEAAKPVKARFEVRFTAPSGPVALSREITLTPARHWSVYLFHHSHTDIGYTELQSRVARNHVEYLDSVVKYCRETDGYPDEAKFRWNIEVTWALENFVRTRPEADVKALVDLIRSGRIELSALYLQLSDCFAHEEIVRTVDAAKAFARRYGFDIRSAMNNDVNGFAWSLPQIFKQAGVRYFATGINETRSKAPLRRPNAFWWESPDGSRILHWNGEHYLFGNYDLLLHEAVDRSAPKVGEYLAKLEARGDYPQDIIAFNVGAWTTDNCPPGRALSDRVKEWNERFESPKLRLATMREFFERMEKELRREAPGPQARLARLLDRRRGLDGLRDRAQPDRPQRDPDGGEGRGDRGQARSVRGVPLPGRRDPGRPRRGHALRRAHLGRLQFDRRALVGAGPRPVGGQERLRLRRPGDVADPARAAGPRPCPGSSPPAARMNSAFSIRSPGRGRTSSASRFRRARCARPRAGSGSSTAGRERTRSSRCRGRMP